MPHFVNPSILSADFGDLKSEINMINISEADAIHIDVMDGVFVPNISFGFPIIEVIKKYSLKPLDVHLMIQAPDHYIDRFIKAGADTLMVHYETCTSLNRTINAIKHAGAKAGVVINPHTPISLLEDIITDVDVVLVMSVNPGFGGQSFIPGTFQKIEKLKNLIVLKRASALIEVDGGVCADNAPRLIKSGADILVAGNFIFKSSDPVGAISGLKLIDSNRKEFIQ